MKRWNVKNGFCRGVGLALALTMCWNALSGAGPAFAKTRSDALRGFPQNSAETEPTPPATEEEGDLLSAGETRVAATLDLESGLYYTVENGEVTITDYANHSEVTTLVIPEEIAGLPVTATGYKALSAFPSKLESVTLPEGLKVIGRWTFQGCEKLKSVNIPSTVTVISERAFEGTMVTEVTLPEGLTQLGKYAFRACTKLGRITIPGNLGTMGEYAFAGCTALTECTLAEGVTAISDTAFSGCTALIRITLPQSLTSIGFKAFEGCTALREVSLPPQLKTIGNSAFDGCSALAELSLPSSLHTVGNLAFQNCTSLTHINIPAGVEDWSYPFEGSGLVSISFEEGVERIASNLFQNCHSLVSVYLPQGVTLIDDYAFKNCSSLKTLYLAGDSVRFGYRCLQGCGQLTSLYFYGAAPSDISTSVFLGHPDVGQITLYYVEGESGWTTPTWKGYRARPFQKGLLLDEPVYNNGSEYHHLVYDVETGEPIQGAKAVANSTPARYTDANGMVVLPSDTVVLTVEAEGYAPVTQYYNGGGAVALSARRYDEENGARVTTLNKDKGVGVTQAYLNIDGKTKNIRTTKKWLNTCRPPETMSISFVTKGTYATAKLEQGAKVIAAIPNSTQKSFEDLDLARFEADKAVWIRLYDASGKKLCEQKTLLNIMSKEPSGWAGGLEFGGSASISISRDCPFLGGLDLGVALPSFPVSVSGDVEGLHIVFGVSTDLEKSDLKDAEQFKNKLKDMVDPKRLEQQFSDYGAQSKQALSEFKQLKQTLTAAYEGLKLPEGQKRTWAKGFSCSLELIGYADAEWGLVDPRLGSANATGKAVLLVTMEGKFSTNTLVGVVPVVLRVTATGSAKAGIEIQIGEEFDWNATLDLGAELRLDAGVGLADIVEFGLYGSGGLEIGTLLAGRGRGPQLDSVKITGEFGARAQVLVFEATGKILSGELIVVENGELKKAGKEAITRSELRAALTGEEEYHLMTRDYLEERTDWLAGEDGAQLFSLTAGNVKTMQAGAYPGAKPQLATNGETTMIVYVDDDASRSSANRTRLMYSLYDPAADSWAQPKPVTPESATADFAPVTAVVGNDVYVLWQGAKTELTESMTMTEMSAALELKLARYDETSGAFTDVQTLTDNEIYETAPRLADVNGAPVAYWVENSAGDPLCQRGSNTICRAEKSGDGWTRSEVATAQAPVAALRAGTLGTDEVVAWTVETAEAEAEGQLTRKGYLWTAGGQGATELGAVNAFYLTQVGADNTPALAWYDGTDLKYITTAAGEPANLVETGTLERTPYAILSNADGSKRSILYTGSHGEEGANLYAVTYDSAKDVWGLPVALTEETELYVENISASYVGQDLVVTFQRSQVDEALNRTVELCWLKAPEGAELELTGVECLSDSLIPGGPVTLQATVRNKGTLTSGGTETLSISGITVTQTVRVPELKGGEETELEFSGVLPASLTGASCAVGLNGTMVDVPLDLADLELTVEQYVLGRKNVGIVTVTNKGTRSAGGVLNFTGNNGESVYQSVPFARLAAGESAQVPFTVENDFFADQDRVVVAVELDCTESQQFYGNDSAVLDLHKVYGGIDWAELAMTDAGALTGQLCNDSEETVRGTLILAAYDANGRQLGARTAVVELPKETGQTLSWSKTGAAYYKVFLLTENNTPWLTETVRPT